MSSYFQCFSSLNKSRQEKEENIDDKRWKTYAVPISQYEDSSRLDRGLGDVQVAEGFLWSLRPGKEKIVSL